MKKKLFIITIAVLALLMTACGNNEEKATEDAIVNEALESGYSMPADGGYAMDMEAAAVTEEKGVYEDAVYEEPAEIPVEESAAGSSSNVVNSNQKLIKTVDIALTTTSFDTTCNSIEASAVQFSGYLESSSVSGTGNDHTAFFVVRVPAEKLDAFEASLTGIGTLTNRSSNIQDVTLQYTDTKARIESLKTEQATLNDLLSKAENIDEIIALQGRLTEVRYEIESYTSQLKVMENQISYSTVTINVTEVKTETAVSDDDFGTKAGKVFSDGIFAFVDGFAEFILFLVENILPLLLLVGIVIAIVFIVKHFIKKRRAKKAAKTEVAKAETETVKETAAKKNASSDNDN